ncbi:hypothetical protein LNV23_19070 [Paucibacter sp. DJ1R-11]|uniref:hypothetical protein n=1 Tax=Paucibacter sp. DJ1R-11 TaxID=2893556 RepID=UPI0021E50073|nr:hypothetical protein [Paucibacter sp. DJ1R-11]MCV2365556.1 hypothetical protein [Paucibacter sp. DJ1R-11]
MSAAARRCAQALSELHARIATADQRAYQIADQAAVADIEGNCASVRDAAGLLWYDTRPMLDDREYSPECIDMNRASLDHAAERGLIVRRLSEPHMVHIKTFAAPAANDEPSNTRPTEAPQP